MQMVYMYYENLYQLFAVLDICLRSVKVKIGKNDGRWLIMHRSCLCAINFCEQNISKTN